MLHSHVLQFTDNTAVIIIFSDPPFYLAKLTEFEAGETLGISASVDTNDSCHESGDTFIEVHDFDVTFVGRSYVDAVVIIPTSPNLVDNITPTPLMHSMLYLHAH